MVAALSGSSAQTCGTCHGLASVQNAPRFLCGSTDASLVMIKGKIIKDPCNSCLVRSQAGKALNIRSSSVDAGRIRLSGEGEAENTAALPAGDLYGLVRKEHNIFERDSQQSLL